MSEPNQDSLKESHRLLRIYLNDHHAGADTGLALARRIRDSNRATPLGDDMERIAAEISDDRDLLDRIMNELDVRRNPLTAAGGALASGVVRLKTRGGVRRSVPLGRVLELEALVSGVLAKRCLWTSLMVCGQVLQTADESELRRRSQRASAQLERLSDHHRRAAATALGSTENHGEVDAT